MFRPTRITAIAYISVLGMSGCCHTCADRSSQWNLGACSSPHTCTTCEAHPNSHAYKLAKHHESVPFAPPHSKFHPVPSRPVFAPKRQLADGRVEMPLVRQRRNHDVEPNRLPAQTDPPLEEVPPPAQELRIVPELPDPETATHRTQTNEIIPVDKQTLVSTIDAFTDKEFNLSEDTNGWRPRGPRR